MGETTIADYKLNPWREKDGTRVVAAEKAWAEPLKWNKAAAAEGVRRRVFCASLADVFEDWPYQMLDHQGYGMRVRGSQWGNWDACDSDTTLTMDDVRSRLFALIDATPHLDWLLVTKRPENVRRMWPGWDTNGFSELDRDFEVRPTHRPNVWLLTSVSDQPTADAMIPELLKCRDLVPVLGASYEPVLGPVDWTPWLNRLDWIIVGSESGHKRRPMDVEWAASTARQCRESGVAFFMKQMEVDGKVTGEIDKFPENLRVREWPNAKGGAR